VLVFFEDSGAIAHHVRLDVGLKNRVEHAYAVVLAQDVADVGHVLLGALADENFVGRHSDAARFEVAFDNGVEQKRVAANWAAPLEGAIVAHLVHAAVHSLDHAGYKRQRYVAAVEPDGVLLGVEHRKNA